MHHTVLSQDAWAVLGFRHQESSHRRWTQALYFGYSCDQNKPHLLM